MKDIATLIRENRKEAIELLKGHDGMLFFVDENNVDMTDEKKPKYVGDNIMKENIPWVIVPFTDDLADIAVLGVRLGEDELNNTIIEFIGFDKEPMAVLWFDDTECASSSENEIYLAIDEFIKKKK